MSIIDALSTSTATASKTTSEKDLDSFVGTREDFLTILLAQLKHQDPLAPMEGTEFIDSITRLSSVEQDVNQNSHLEKIVGLLEGENAQFGNPVSYLDREIEFNSQKFHMENGVGEFSYTLAKRPEELFVIIRDDSGKTVFAGNGNNNVGMNKFTWDGKNNNGTLQDDGNYTVEISYINDKGETTLIPTATKGVVSGANFAGDDPMLIVDGIEVRMENVISVNSLKDEPEVSGS